MTLKKKKKKSNEKEKREKSQAEKDLEEPESQQRKEREEQRQKKLQEIIKADVGQVIRGVEDQLYSVYGRVAGISPPFRMIKAREESECYECGTKIPRKEFAFPIFQIPPFGVNVTCKNNECALAIPAAAFKCEYIPTMRLELTDPDSLADIVEVLPVYVFGDDTNDIRLGGCCEITGPLHTELGFKNRRVMSLSIYARSVSFDSSEDSSESLELSDSDKEAMERFVHIVNERERKINEIEEQMKKRGEKITPEIQSKIRGGNRPVGLIETLVWMHSPEVIKLDFIKEGSLLTEVSTTTGTQREENMKKQKTRTVITTNRRRDKINVDNWPARRSREHITKRCYEERSTKF